MTFVAGNELMYIFRVFLACVCGGVIGIERQRRTKVAGIKTHMMISIAAALMGPNSLIDKDSLLALRCRAFKSSSASLLTSTSLA